MEEQEEIRPIPGFEEYAVSDLGNVYSYKYGRVRKLKQCTGPKGKYKVVGMSKEGSVKQEQVHRLVAAAFLGYVLKSGHNNGSVNHKDWNTFNNRLDNLEIIPMRENCIHGKSRWRKTSKYVGVSWDKKRGGRWLVHIQYQGKNYHLGYFTDEDEAGKVYQKNLADIRNGCFWHPSFEADYNPYRGGRNRRSEQKNN